MHALALGKRQQSQRGTYDDEGRVLVLRSLAMTFSSFIRDATKGGITIPLDRLLVLLADAHLVLKPDFYRCARREVLADFRHAYGKVFLNASMASASCL